MKSVRLILAIHNHQPVGNFDKVFAEACEKAYKPFLDEMERHPEIRFVLHNSGCLLEWMEAHEPRLVERVKGLISSGRVEIIGGGFYEPIFTMLPEQDRIGQIRLYSDHLQERFGVRVRGMWLPERVWEQSLVRSIVDAGIEYTVVDDFHFKKVGLRDPELVGYFLTEDEGRILKIFPGSERLRYLIPFGLPEETISYLREFATEDGRNVIVYADDGEKFGMWPKTHKHVYLDGWLRRFLEALEANRDWIRLTTFAEVADHLSPVGHIYLSDASYREMTEWALPPQSLMELEDIQRELGDSPLRRRLRPFIGGGFWRNFKVKYPEARRMYARMIATSRRVAEAPPGTAQAEARRELYRGQCNCGYWHGVFGGLYLPYLRFETYRHLIRAETLLDSIAPPPSIEIHDFDLDGHPEVKLADQRLNAYISPYAGGRLYELDHRSKAFNLLATLARRKEAYHRKLVEAAATRQTSERVASIHDLVRAKEEGLERLLHYDPYLRDSFIDHVLDPSAKREEIESGRYPEWSDSPEGVFAFELIKSRPPSVRMTRTVTVRVGKITSQLRLSKTARLERDGLVVDYEIEPGVMPVRQWTFAVEFNFGLQAGNAPDRYYRSHTGENLGNLSTRMDLHAQPAIGVVDEWLAIEARLEFSEPAMLWTFPVETVSESEDGFERNYQSSVVMARWIITGTNPFRLSIRHLLLDREQTA